MIDYKKLKQVIDELPNGQDIILGGHKNTDYDSIGSGFSLAIFLNKIGKKAYFLLEEKDYSKLEWFGNYKYIIKEYDINKKYNFILVDSNCKSRLGIFEKYFDNANITINIDHHEENKEESDYIFKDESVSATCEIVYNLIKLYNNIDKEIATLLYAGIATDTNCFYKRLNSNTMKIASELLEYNIDNVNIIKNTYKNISLEESKILSDMINNIQYNIFHYIVLDRNNSLYKDVDYSVIFKKCASYIYEIKDIKILGLFLIELDGIITGLYRSNCDIDVDKLAIMFGGGGHKKASGFETNISIEEILKTTKEYIKEKTN